MKLKKQFIVTLILSITLGIGTSVFAEVAPNNIAKEKAQEEKNKEWLRTLFKEMYEDPTTDFTKLIPKKYSKNYTQWVDGKTMGYDDILKHRLAQKKVISDIKITFEHMVAEGDKVCTIHWVHAKKKDGSEVIAKVIALFQIQNGKLVLCDEMTHQIKGTKEDADLGSRQ